jgi:hypothetical protein
MSRNTYTIMEILESYGNYQGKTLQEILNLGRTKVFDFEYPIFDPDYKVILEKKILAHFMDFEICFPTVHRWKFYLQNRLNEIMPYYNELYKTTLFEYNPLHTVNMEKSIIQKSKSENETSSKGKTENETSNKGKTENETSSKGKEKGNGSTKNTSIFNDTPKSAIDDVESLRYATNVTIDTSSGNNENETEGQGTAKTIIEDQATGKILNEDQGNAKNLSESEYIEKIVGKEGGESYQSLIESFRKNILQIDKEIIKNLYTLFVLVYDPCDFD